MKKIPTILLPPKTPFRLAIYFLCLYLILSLVWSFIIRLPTEGSKEIVTIIFAVAAFFYGKIYGKALSFHDAMLTALYVITPILLIRMLPVIGEADFWNIPVEDRWTFYPFMFGVLVVAVTLPAALMGLILSFVSKWGAKSSTLSNR